MERKKQLEEGRKEGRKEHERKLERKGSKGWKEGRNRRKEGNLEECRKEH